MVTARLDSIAANCLARPDHGYPLDSEIETCERVSGSPHFLWESLTQVLHTYTKPYTKIRFFQKYYLLSDT